MFLRNYWYVATWAKDLGREPLARIMLNEPVVLFRKQDGTPVALEDRCIHRRLPLSMGRLIGDEIQCHYHGLVFDGTGTCVKIPGQERIPPSARVKSYPVVERNQCIFVWMGDADAPDTSRLPTHFGVLDNEGWTTSLVYRPVQCNYQLINDNLLDLSHLATVHASTVGTAHVADLADVEAERDGNHVKVSRWTMDAPAATTYQQFGNYDGNIDRWQISEFFPPSYFRINNGAASANTGARDGKGDKRWDFWVSHGITPETESSTHYFWGTCPQHLDRQCRRHRRVPPPVPPRGRRRPRRVRRPAGLHRPRSRSADPQHPLRRRADDGATHHRQIAVRRSRAKARSAALAPARHPARR